MHNRNRQFYKVIAIALSIIYTASLIYLVFFARRRRHLEERYLNLVPVKNMVSQFIHMRQGESYNYYTNLFGNIILFIPVSYILIAALGIKRFGAVILTGFLISFFIELIQYVFEVGVADVDDIILNTLGTAIGFYFCQVFAKFHNRKISQ